MLIEKIIYCTEQELPSFGCRQYRENKYSYLEFLLILAASTLQDHGDRELAFHQAIGSSPCVILHRLTSCTIVQRQRVQVYNEAKHVWQDI